MNIDLQRLNRIYLLLLGALLTLITLAVPSAQAGKLEVINNAAAIGTKGLRVTAGVLCATNDLIVSGPTITTDQIACNTITSNGTAQVTSPVTFTSVGIITLNPGFGVTSGITFGATIDPFVAVNDAYVESSTPNSETSYNVRFEMNFDALNLAINDNIDIFQALSANGDLQFGLVLVDNGSGKRLEVNNRQDSGLSTTFANPTFQAGFNDFFIEWKSGNGHGLLQLTINKQLAYGNGSLSNSLSRIDSIRWGLENVGATTGHIDQDDFVSFR